MRFRILTLLILLSTSVFGQSVQKCDGTILLSTSQNIERLTQKEIADFLLTFGQECRTNIEYSEWSNELLFSILDKHTDLIIKTIEQVESKIEIGAILDDLSEPIHDMVDIKNLTKKVEKVEIRKELKDKILERLKTAAEEMK